MSDIVVDPRTLLPRHRGDSERVEALVALGYPAVAPVLPQLLEWLQDANWPIANRVSRFLAQIGAPVLPHIREVFAGDDDIWKYWCIELVVMQFSPAIAEQLRGDLQRIAYHPLKGEKDQEVDEQARAALAWLNQLEGV